MSRHQSAKRVFLTSCVKCWRRQQQQHSRINISTRVKSSSSANKTATSSSKKRPWWHNEHPLMISKTTNPTGYSLSEICGNVSFVFVCIAYLNTDILRLRLLTTGSIFLSVVFQYYRQIPLWIPIRWNALLLAINSAMTASLIAERRRAELMPPELEGIYQTGLFEKRGFSKVEFVRLFDKATKTTFQKGEKLAREGEMNRTLYFVAEGNIQIQRKGRKLALMTANTFIGEMTFLDYITEEEETPNSNNQNSVGSMATADAVVQTDQVVAYVWDFSSLRDYLRGEREVRNALSAYMNHDLRAKLASLNNASAAAGK